MLSFYQVLFLETEDEIKSNLIQKRAAIPRRDLILSPSELSSDDDANNRGKLKAVERQNNELTNKKLQIIEKSNKV